MKIKVPARELVRTISINILELYVEDSPLPPLKDNSMTMTMNIPKITEGHQLLLQPATVSSGRHARSISQAK
jgi:hypothetical protein